MSRQLNILNNSVKFLVSSICHPTVVDPA